jgi:hypothetical protein
MRPSLTARLAARSTELVSYATATLGFAGSPFTAPLAPVIMVLARDTPLPRSRPPAPLRAAPRERVKDGPLDSRIIWGGQPPRPLLAHDGLVLPENREGGTITHVRSALATCTWHCHMSSCGSSTSIRSANLAWKAEKEKTLQDMDTLPWGG